MVVAEEGDPGSQIERADWPGKWEWVEVLWILAGGEVKTKLSSPAEELEEKRQNESPFS